MMRKSLLGGLALAAAVLFTGPSAQAGEKVRVGICVSWPGYSMFEVAKKMNLAPGYDIEEAVFEDPVGGHSAIAAGQIDIYLCTGDYTPLIVERATDVVNVTLLNPSYGVDQVVLAPGVTAETLKGKKIGAPQAYIGQLLMGLWLDGVGLQPKDVEWVNLNADEAVGPMISGDLAAAYMYEPWVSKVVENLPETKSIANTAEPRMLGTGIFMDVMFMNKNFIKEHRQAALDMLKAHWDAVQYWHDHTAEANQVMADFTKWPLADIEAVIGTNGKSLEGGIYVMDFDEAARVCGAIEGDGPFGLKHDGMAGIYQLTNEWWVKLGLQSKVMDQAPGIDCSLMADLAKSGFRQSIAAR